VGFPHVRVGHRQASKLKRVTRLGGPFLIYSPRKSSYMGSPMRELGEHRLPQANQSIALVGANARTRTCGPGLIKNCGAWPWMAAVYHLSGIENRMRRACERPSDITRAAGQAQLGARLLN
jgi:hypothetical protein